MTDLFLTVDSGTIDWSRAQFALTAIYHWLFVPLTLGLAVIMGICETIYYRNRKRFWKDASRFWLSSVPTGATTHGLWATFSVLLWPSRVLWLSSWSLPSWLSCILDGRRYRRASIWHLPG